MLCSHCEATVKKALENLEQVTSATVHHEKNQAVVHLNASISDKEIKDTIEEAGYEVTEIK